MSTNLIPYSDMKAMARDIAASGLFGMKNEQQVMALMALAQAEGKHPAIVARDYDIIQNKPAKKSEAMLRDFISGGGKVEWHRMDDACADATFSHSQGGTVRITWDMERARQAQLAGKDMWKKFPRQMLRARVVSEGVRAVGPFATSGLYVPEEVRDMPPVVTVVGREEPAVIEHKPEADATLSEEQIANVRALMTEVGANEARFLKYLRVNALTEILACNYGHVIEALERKRRQG